MILISILAFMLYVVIIPAYHYYQWNSITPPNNVLWIFDLIASLGWLIMIPVIIGSAIGFVALFWFGYVLLAVPDGEPDWDGLIDHDDSH